jgi:two-component system C4-dicarboxylate transport response regulator DctD
MRSAQDRFSSSSGTFPIGSPCAAPRVLVADDDPQLLRLIARLLRGARIEVETAASPDAAIELLSKIGFDLVLSDLFAPEMSARALVAAVRRSDPLVPIVIVSGLPDGREAIVDSHLHFVCKPFANEALLTLVNQLVGLDRDAQLAPERRVLGG